LISRSDMSHIRRLSSVTTGECAISWTMPWKLRLRTR
jgi:hypothetical protein